jgi:hypothetical protein
MQVSIGTEQFTIEVWCAHSAFENVSRSDSNRQADSFEPILMPQSAVATPVSLPVDIRVAQSDSRGGPARGLRTLRVLRPGHGTRASLASKGAAPRDVPQWGELRVRVCRSDSRGGR